MIINWSKEINVGLDQQAACKTLITDALVNQTKESEIPSRSELYYFELYDQKTYKSNFDASSQLCEYNYNNGFLSLFKLQSAKLLPKLRLILNNSFYLQTESKLTQLCPW